MWFNKKNCVTKKAKAWTFKACRKYNSPFADRIWGGKDYYEWGFQDFYAYKTKSEY
jgi:hypothetical protein